ncbi:MAG: helix-turn-helix domain-containing protein [Clostridia bacterium]|nr:helix-turn-helix domain-containing protein [Clostridia bacterium]
MRRNFVHKNVLLGFIYSYIPIILLIFILQTVSVYTILHGLEKNSINVIENAISRDVSMVEQKLWQSESIAFSLSQNAELSPFIQAGEDVAFTFAEQQRFKTVVKSYHTGNPLIENIVLQNDVRDQLVSCFAFYTKRINFYKSSFAEGTTDGEAMLADSETAIDFSADGMYSLSGGMTPVVPYVMQLPFNEERTGSVTIYMNKNTLLSNVLDLVENSGGMIQIYDRQNELLLEEGVETEGISLFDNVSGSKTRINGETYCVFKESAFGYRWRYVLLLPEKYVLGDTKFYRVFSLCFNFLSILGGFILCFFASLRKSRSYLELVDLLGIGVGAIDFKGDEFKHLYPHISQTKQENKELSQSGIQTALNMLLTGAFGNAKEIENELLKCKIVFNGDNYGVLAIRHENKRQSDHFGENFKNFLQQEIQTLIPDAQIYFADKNTTVLLFAFDYGPEQFYSYAKLCISRLECEIFLKYQIPVLFGVGKTAHEIKDIKTAYAQALEVVAYNQLISGYNQWLYSEMPKQTDDWYYPIELENALFESVLEANFSTARDVLAKIREENFVNRQLSVENINELLGELKASIKKISSLQSEEIEFEQMGASVHHFFEYTINFFYMLCSNSEQRPRTRGDKICRDIQNYIGENYHDPALSLNSLAAQYHLNPSYLSTLFKKNVDCGLASYLENVRIAKACELLLNGKHTINDIAEKVGFSNNLTFRRSFKKLKGVNPSDYGKN